MTLTDIRPPRLDPDQGAPGFIPYSAVIFNAKTAKHAKKGGKGIGTTPQALIPG